MTFEEPEAVLVLGLEQLEALLHLRMARKGECRSRIPLLRDVLAQRELRHALPLVRFRRTLGGERHRCRGVHHRSHRATASGDGVMLRELGRFGSISVAIVVALAGCGGGEDSNASVQAAGHPIRNAHSMVFVHIDIIASAT
jgi:hypothetical protein